MTRVPYVSIILKNTEGEVFLLLRDNQSTVENPNHGTPVGGIVEEQEFPEMAAHESWNKRPASSRLRLDDSKLGIASKL
jgi:hypothetical protein